MFRSLICALGILAISTHGPGAREKALPEGIVPGKRSVIAFAESPPQSAVPEQLRYRLMAAETPPPYDVTRESFEVIVPETYDPKKPHGLFIWISPGKTPSIPKAWEPVLAEKHLIFVGARNSQNGRNIFDRIRMAIDANHGMRRKFNVDGRRVYVSGFSGGGRVASMLGIAWGEMFSGTACFMGVNFYTDVPAEDGKVYGMNFIPDEQIVPVAKKFCRYALVTAEKDFNRPNMRAVFEHGFRKEGFENVKLFEVPELGHQLPPGEWLGKAIDFLDEGKLPAPESK